MFICFVYSRESLPGNFGFGEVIKGSGSSLNILRNADTGPFYPHLAERVDDHDYRFFAGHIAGVRPSSNLPQNHPVANKPVECWEFDQTEPGGSWLALKYDRRENKVSLAAGIFLLQRWYYYRQGDTWYLSNSLWYLKRILGKSVTVDVRAIPYMLNWGSLPGGYTPLKDVFVLGPGQVLHIGADGYRLENRTDSPFVRHPSSDGGPPPEKIAQVLQDAVAQELDGLDSVLIPLSGGTDSRFLLGCALKVMPKNKILTLTYGNPASLDWEIGRKLAGELGLKNIAMDMDRRPVGQQAAEEFFNTEGMYWTRPDYPIKQMREVLTKETYILSGYIGDFVFGSYEVPEEIAASWSDDVKDKLKELIRENMPVSPSEVRPVLADGNLDPWDMGTSLMNSPGSTLQEKFDSWAYWNYLTNRTNFALFHTRSKAFYLAPFVHRSVLNLAGELTPDQRRGERAYFEALKALNIKLYEYPTTSFYGHSLTEQAALHVTAVRMWRRLWAEADKLIGTRLGVILYHHPREKSYHERDLMRKAHRGDILKCLNDLRAHPAFNPAGLDEIRNRYLNRQPVNRFLLRGLLTVRQWLQYYEA